MLASDPQYCIKERCTKESFTKEHVLIVEVFLGREIMRLAKLGVAVAATISSMSLYAQSTVQIYGIADAGVEYVNKVRLGAAGSPTGSVVRLQSGNESSSRIGFRGREDLGDGLAAIFTLENGFSIDSGTLGQGGRLFGRQAYVGLAGRLGEMQLGRQTTAIYDFGAVFDPLVAARYGATFFDAAYASRADNAVKYVGSVGGLNVGGQYSLGYDSLIANGSEVPGAFKVGKEMGVHTNYTVGRVQIGAAYDRQNGNSVATGDNKNQRMDFGATVDFTPVKLLAGYQRQLVTTGLTTAANKLYWVAMQYATTAALTLTPAVYVNDPDGNNNKSTMFAVLGSYALSKRTDLYSQVAFMKNQNAATLGMGGAVNPGDSQTAMTVGIRHRF
jgi:predicted porin